MKPPVSDCPTKHCRPDSSTFSRTLVKGYEEWLSNSVVNDVEGGYRAGGVLCQTCGCTLYTCLSSCCEGIQDFSWRAVTGPSIEGRDGLASEI